MPSSQPYKKTDVCNCGEGCLVPLQNRGDLGWGGDTAKFTGALNEQEPWAATQQLSLAEGADCQTSHPVGWGGAGLSAIDFIFGTHRKETALSSGQVVPLTAITGKLPLSEAFSQNPQLLTCDRI